MKKYIVIGVLLLVGLLVSLALIPDSNELALMQFRDKRFEEAKAAYEQRLNDGTLTVDVVSALTDLHLQYGDVDEAIAVMKRFVEAHPNNIQALKELGRLYQYAQRPDDYLRNLEEINRLQSSGKALQTLAEMYGASEQYDKQEPALEEMLDEHGIEKQPQHYRYLASLQASQEKIKQAIETLREFQELFPVEFNFDDTQLLVSLLLDDGQDDAAYEQAKAWAVASTSAAEIARLVNILHYKGSPELGWRLISLYNDEEIYNNIDLATEKAYLHINRGESDAAYNLMGWLYDRDRLPAGLYRDYLFLALDNGDNEKAVAIAQALNVDELSESDALALAELLVLRHDKDLYDILRHKLGQDSIQSRYATLAAVMAVIESRADAAERLQSIDVAGIANSHLLQIARICSLKRRSDCVDRFLSAVNYNNISIQDTVYAAELYMDVGKLARATDILAPIYEQNKHMPEVSSLRVRIAAANGDTVFVDRWLSKHPNLTEKQYKDIFFTAQKYRQYNTSAMIAERYHSKYANDNSRTLLVNTYLMAKRYEDAIPYLRELKDYNEQSRNDYLAILMNLARHKPQYNAELANFAAKHLRSSNVPQRQKQALIYALLEAGRADLALPYIREFAQKRGGEWVEIYAANLDKVGRHDEARDFRMQIAMDPQTSAKTRRSIGFVLLENGYKDDALKVFADLAANAPADSADVQQLLYLWGPRLSPDQLDWIAYRAINATDLDEQDAWLKYLAAYADAESLVSFMQRNPDMVGSPILLDNYIAALQRLDKFQQMQQEMAKLAEETQNPSLLRVYARTAYANNMPRLALSAYRKLDEIVGGDPEAERNIGLISYSLADYSNTKEYLQRYTDYRLENERYHKDDYQAFFYLAEVYRRDRHDDLARPYYEKVLELADMALEKTTDIISKQGQSLIALGKKEEGYALMSNALQESNDALLRADYISTLIEQKEYEQAQEILQEANFESSAYSDGDSGEQIIPVALNASNLRGYRIFSNNNEILLEFEGVEGQNLAMTDEQIKHYSWVSYSTQGYDRALIVAKPSYTLSLQPTSSGYVIVPEKKSVSENSKLQRDLQARYEMLQARIELETGKHYQAAKRLNDSLPLYPDNPTLVGYAANADNFVGKWKHALKLLDIAEKQMPENEDIKLLKRDIWLQHGEYAKLDYEWFRQGDSDQNIWTIEAMAFIDDVWEAGLKLQHNDIDAVAVNRIDGRTGDFATTKQRGELYIAHEDDEGTRVKAALFGNNDGIGFGGYYSWHHEFGHTELAAEYHRPNWLFVDGVLDDATRDRIAVTHNYKPNPKWLVGGSVSLNRYNVKGEDAVADSLGITASITRQLRDIDPYLAVNYALDAEYRIGEKTFTNNAGTSFVPLLDGREVHTLSLVYDQDLGKDTDILLQGGYSYERLGGDHGPLAAGRLTHQMFDDQLEAQIRASYGAFTNDNVGDTARVGGHVKWRF